MINYPYLPPGREIKLVPADHPYMQAAKQACRELSTDLFHPTGAVVVLADQIIAREGNQAALQHPAWQAKHAAGWCVRRWLKIPSGQKYWLCPGCSTFRHHSESRAARTAVATGLDLTQAELYLWGHWWCCEPCWQAMIKAGIGSVYLMAGGEVLFNRSHPDHQIGKFDI